MAVPVVDGRTVVGAWVVETVVPAIAVVEGGITAAVVKVVEGDDEETMVVVEAREIEVPDEVIDGVVVNKTDETGV